MASRQGAKALPPAPLLYLVTETVDDAGALVRGLEQALSGADIAAVLLRLPDTGESSRIKLIKAVAPLVQERGAALLLDGASDLVARSGADGAHLTGIDALKAALPGLKPARIAGAGGLKSRHDAMLAGEAGADYVMFGEPDAAGLRPPFPPVLERVAWWSEIFEVPCVGFAAGPDEVTKLSEAGADFIALGRFVWEDQRGPAAAVASAAERLRSVELA